MNAKYIDAHCHLQFDAYDADRAEILERMKAQSVAGIVIGTDQKIICRDEILICSTNCSLLPLENSRVSVGKAAKE